MLWKAERFQEAIEQDRAALLVDGEHPFLTGSERFHLNFNLAQMEEE